MPASSFQSSAPEEVVEATEASLAAGEAPGAVLPVLRLTRAVATAAEGPATARVAAEDVAVEVARTEAVVTVAEAAAVGVGCPESLMAVHHQVQQRAAATLDRVATHGTQILRFSDIQVSERFHSPYLRGRTGCRTDHLLARWRHLTLSGPELQGSICLHHGQSRTRWDARLMWSILRKFTSSIQISSCIV